MIGRAAWFGRGLVLVLASCGRPPADGPGTVERLPIRAGDGEIVHRDDCVGDFAVDGDRIFISGNTSVPASGRGEPRRFTERPGSVLAVDESHVYLAEEIGGHDHEHAIFRVRKGTKAIEPFASVHGTVGDFKLDRDAAYFLVHPKTTEQRLALYTVPKRGGAPRVLADASSGFVFPVQIAVDDESVYITDWGTDRPREQPEAGVVRVVPKTGGPLRTIARRPAPQALAVDDRFVYFGTSESGSIFRVPKQGGNVDEIDQGGGHARFIVAGRDRLAVLFEGYRPRLQLRFVAKERRATQELRLDLHGEATRLEVTRGFVYVGSYALHPHQGCVGGMIVRVPFE